MLILILFLNILDLILVVGLPFLFAFKTPKNRHPKKIFYVLGIAAFTAAIIATMVFRNDVISVILLSTVYSPDQPAVVLPGKGCPCFIRSFTLYCCF